MSYFLAFLGTAVIVVVIVLLVRLFEELEYLDGAEIAGSTVMLMTLLAVGIAIEIAGIDYAGSKIETKEIIAPDTLVFSRNGASDTTYVYNRPIIKNDNEKCSQ